MPKTKHLQKYHWPHDGAKEAGSHHAAKYDMRGLLMFMLIAGIGGGLFLWQKQNERNNAPAEANASTQQQSKPALTPAPRGQASEYNWMKRSLDRAADVRDQARARTKEAQDQ